MCQICKKIFNLIFLKERTVLVFSLKIPYSSEDNKTECLNCALHCNFCPWCQPVKSCLMHDYPYRRKLGKIFCGYDHFSSEEWGLDFGKQFYQLRDFILGQPCRNFKQSSAFYLETNIIDWCLP